MTVSNEIKVIKKLIREAKFSEAEILLKTKPFNKTNPEYSQLLGVIAFQKQRFTEAVVFFEKAEKQLSDDGFLQNNLGHVYKILGLKEKAKLAFKKAADCRIDFAEPLNQLGLLFKQEGLLEQAQEVFLKAISRNKDFAEAHYNFAVLLEEMDRSSEAREYYKCALKAKPDYVQAINNLGVITDELGEHKNAEKLYRNGISISPKTPELYCSLGSCLQQQGKYSEAVNEFHKAVKLDPDFLINKWNLGFLQLAMGNLSEGWENYRYRHTVDRQSLLMPTKRLPLNLEGQIIRVTGEQGLGDQIFFSRFLSELKNRGATIKFKPDLKIQSLFQRMDGITVGDINVPDYSIADLPYLLENNTIVNSVIFEPKEENQLRMLRRLAHCGSPPYIGVTYQAGGVGAKTLFKIAPTGEIGSVLSENSSTIISVQRNPKTDELNKMSTYAGREVFNFSDVNENLEDALALMAVLDDYIGVSNTNLHLRAAVGRSARVLVTHPGEFRWQVRGSRSPWFPNFELYRQDFNLSWERAFAKLGVDIKKKYD